MMNIKELYASCGKRRGKAAWKLGVQANVLVKKNQRVLERITVKLVFLASRAKKNDWICLLPANPGMDEREVIGLYAKRWNIMPMSA